MHWHDANPGTRFVLVFTPQTLKTRSPHPMTRLNRGEKIEKYPAGSR
jgi:hypothetical protein